MVLLEDEIRSLEDYGRVGGIFYLIYTCIVGGLFLLNLRNSYLDLRTTERRSVLQDPKPERNGAYVLMILVSQTATFFYLMTDIFMTLSYFISSNTNSCNLLLTLAGAWGIVSKAMLYNVFLIRMYWLYGRAGEQIRYKLENLVTLAMLVVVYEFASISFSVAFDGAEYISYGSKGQFPNYCLQALPIIVGGK